MKKLGGVIWKIILLLAFLPLVKTFYDVFTNPVDGWLVAPPAPWSPADANTIAVVTAIPWVFPITIIIWLIIDLTKPDEPEPPSGFGKFKFPQG